MDENLSHHGGGNTCGDNDHNLWISIQLSSIENDHLKRNLLILFKQDRLDQLKEDKKFLKEELEVSFHI